MERIGCHNAYRKQDAFYLCMPLPEQIHFDEIKVSVKCIQTPGAPGHCFGYLMQASVKPPVTIKHMLMLNGNY